MTGRSQTKTDDRPWTPVIVESATYFGANDASSDIVLEILRPGKAMRVLACKSTVGKSGSVTALRGQIVAMDAVRTLLAAMADAEPP